MNKLSYPYFHGVIKLSTLGLIAALASGHASSNDEKSTADMQGSAENGFKSMALDPTKFVDGALVSEPIIVDCTMSDGTKTSCYQLEIAGVPAESKVGPFCPQSITSDATNSGIWLDGSGTVYQVDGEFILGLPTIYGDSNWHLYDSATGKVNITNTQEACEAAARPNVDVQYQNHCVECSLDYVGGGVSSTILIPVTPSRADTVGRITNVGVSLNGVQLAAPAPVDAILGAYTIAAFDDCGGHVNPNDGYHYHAATGCTEAFDTQSDGHASLLGYALDGHGIYGMLDQEGNESEGLDECRGHSDETRGYHYHAAGAGENMFIGCFTGKTVAMTRGRGGSRRAPPE